MRVGKVHREEVSGKRGYRYNNSKDIFDLKHHQKERKQRNYATKSDQWFSLRNLKGKTKEQRSFTTLCYKRLPTQSACSITHTKSSIKFVAHKKRNGNRHFAIFIYFSVSKIVMFFFFSESSTSLYVDGGLE